MRLPLFLEGRRDKDLAIRGQGLPGPSLYVSFVFFP